MMMRSWTWCRGRVITERFRQEGGLMAPLGAQGMHDPAADIRGGSDGYGEGSAPSVGPEPLTP